MPTKRKVRFRKKPSPKSKPRNNEVTAIGQALRTLGGLGGAVAGSYLGAPTAGSAVGHGLGAAISRWLGQGDYSVSKNSVLRAAANIPMMHKSSQSIVVRHREFVGTIAGSPGFTVQKTLSLNPGLDSTFPWLAGIACQFQEYTVLGMVYHYVPTSGTFNGTTAALGTVMMQTSYRSTDGAPTSKAEMLNEYCANEVVPFETMVHPIECNPKENPFSVHYVRSGSAGASELLMYDLAKTFVATQGQSTDAIIGDLWVTYEIELSKPIVSSTVVTEPVYNAMRFPDPDAANLFKNAPINYIGVPDGFSFSSNTITFPDRYARYSLVFRFDCVGMVISSTASSGWWQPSSVTGSVAISSIDGGVFAEIGSHFLGISAGTANHVFHEVSVTTSGTGTLTIPALLNLTTPSTKTLSLLITRTPTP